MGLEAKISANIDDFQKNLDKAQQAATEFSEKASKSFEKLGQSIQRLALPAAAASLALSAIGLSAVKTFAELEGVKAAFDRLDDPNLLNNLRKATKGTTSDFELMKNAVQASNFKLPVEQLASLMEFASRRAKDTGESVDYLVNSIVTGIGRKSPLILDNLGISATELKEQLNGVSMEAASIADVTEAVGRIASAELLKMGKDSDTLAEKFLRIKTIFTNEMGGMGETISKALSPAINAIENLALKFQALSPEMKNMIVYVGAGIAAFAGLVAAAGAIITIAPLVAAAWAAIGGPIALVATGIAVAAALIIANWDKVKIFVLETTAVVLNKISEMIRTVADFASRLGFDKLAGKISSAAQSMSGKVHSLQLSAEKAKNELALLDEIQKNAQINADLLAKSNGAVATSLNKAGEAAKRAYKNFWALNGIQQVINGRQITGRGVEQKKTIGSLDRGTSINIPTPNIAGILTETQVQAEMVADAFNERFGDVLGQGITDAITDLASGIGEALMSGGSLIDSLGAVFLSSMGNILKQLGSMAIQVGIGIKAVKSALQSLNPVVAIAAGVALVAIGSAFSAGARNLGNSMGSGSGGGYSNSAVRMSDPSTFYKSAPMEIKVSGEFVQRGSDLYAVVERETSRNNRIR